MPIRKAFLSSTGKDLADYRQAVFEAINGLDGWKCVRMEDFGARTRPVHAFDAEAVRSCDLFVGILGHCYGTIPRGHKRSYTEQEYDTAVASNLPRLMFIAPDDFPLPARLREPEDYWKRQQKFRSRAQTDQLPGRFSTAASLANEVLQSIRNWEEEERRKQEEEKLVPVGLAEPPSPAFIAPLGRPDWLASLLAYPRSFVEDFSALVSGPKRFVAERSTAGTLTIGRAFGFLAVNYCIRIPIPPHIHSIPADAASDILFIIAEILTWWMVLFLAWRCVGGRAALEAYLPIHLYYSAINSWLIVIANRVHWGFTRTFDQQLYQYEMETSVKGCDFACLTSYVDRVQNSPAFFWIEIGVITSVIPILLWFVAGWGAYRALNKASRLRSTVAAVMFVILGIPATGLVTAVSQALIAELQ